MTYKAGQRWFSQTEPELGLGLIEKISGRRIQVRFPATEQTRVYAEDKAPLQRFLLKPGQTLTTQEGQQATVQAVNDNQGVMIYQVEDEAGEADIVPEMFLAPELNLDSADKRLLSAQVNHLHWYLLRRRLRDQYAAFQQQPPRGLLGGRLQLTPHQYQIAEQWTRIGPPRLLLSDEVGLGKTIEAGLILQRLLLTGMASRALIVVPDHLLHQWLVEMIRKFDLHVPVFDESRLEALLEEAPDQNPFLSTQLALAPASLWDHPVARDQAAAAGWDCLIVDEAHHLDFTGADPTGAAHLVQQLAPLVPGVLLLSATPEQDGGAGHFERLHLLDPDRFDDPARFRRDNEQLVALGDALDTFLHSVESGAPDASPLEAWCEDAESARLLAEVTAATDPEAREAATEALVSHLIDIRGTGRLQIRNSRRRIPGFPQRQLQTHHFPCPPEYDADTPWPESAVTDWPDSDPRVDWLIRFLRGHTDAARPDKVLLICHRQETALQLEQYLRLQQGLLTSLFHEDMDLVERDRAAAWFAQIEGGAQILICSEIGSEGRNFQLAHTLVCFDLPPHPDQLEQRIGRLDRIGQTDAITIHVPLLEGHRQTQWFRWYHEALDAFQRTCDIGSTVLRRLAESDATALELSPRSDLNELPLLDEQRFEVLLQHSRELATAARQEAERGRNRLLEWQSFHRASAETLVEDIARFESAQSPEQITLDLLEQLGIETTDEGQGIYFLQPGERVIPDTLPEMIEAGCLITFRRAVAIARDDVRFVTWEHPLIEFLLETLDQTWLGSAGVTLIKVPSLPKGSLFLEAAWRPLLQHPQAALASRFLTTGLFRCVVDSQGQDVSRPFTAIDLRDLEQRLDKSTLLAILRTQEDTIEQLVRDARALAGPALEQARQAALAQAEDHFAHELARLQALQDRSGNREQRALEQLHRVRDQVSAAIHQADLHLDSLRLIVNG